MIKIQELILKLFGWTATSFLEPGICVWTSTGFTSAITLLVYELFEGSSEREDRLRPTHFALSVFARDFISRISYPFQNPNPNPDSKIVDLQGGRILDQWRSLPHSKLRFDGFDSYCRNCVILSSFLDDFLVFFEVLIRVFLAYSVVRNPYFERSWNGFLPARWCVVAV